RADAMESQTHASDLGAERYQAVMQPFRQRWLDNELQRGAFEESIVLLNRMLQTDAHSGVLQFYLGEAYRRRNNKDDAPRAIAAYREAIAAGNAPDAAYRGLGMAALKSGDKDTARDAFKEYLARATTAEDRSMVEMYYGMAGGTQ